MEVGAPTKEEARQVLKVLEVLKQASHDLQVHPSPSSAESNSSAIKALLELETESDSILSTDPHLSALSHHLAALRTLISTLRGSRGKLDIKSFLARRVSSHEIFRLAGAIESEIQAWIDRETIEKLTRLASRGSQEEDELVSVLDQVRNRLSQGFNRELQDLILKSKLYQELEWILCSKRFSRRVREGAGFAISELIKFNKDVFVGQVLLGQTVKTLLQISSLSSLKVLCLLVKSIKSPLVDLLESDGEIPKIVGLMGVDELGVRLMAMDCVLEMGYFGRKEAVEAMMDAGLIERLVELQRCELGGDLIEMVRRGEEEVFLEKHPFASCVARFAVQLEVGEGLRQREKRAFKQEIPKKVREVSVSDAEAATIVAEVLWGSSP
ncbi:hypothetical protein RJ639_027165 [Escallonia herrerae]|uniref:Uncharacterized protein n=1 Tax=Escallonia herrerae TaxID=1293975 RepID=A0AA89BF65_9ASTE|nr:hypothetical protein RJ639_027165 [Escallonia herrerae]